jgi:hypothetical protein
LERELEEVEPKVKREKNNTSIDLHTGAKSRMLLIFSAIDITFTRAWGWGASRTGMSTGSAIFEP